MVDNAMTWLIKYYAGIKICLYRTCEGVNYVRVK